jgi:hypothetical protein
LPVPDSPRSSTVVLVRATCATCSQTLAHRAARADQVRKIVALLQLEPQVRVLVDQLLALSLNQAVHAHRLRDHRSDDADEFRGAVVVAVRLEMQIDANGADRLAVERDRRRDVGELLLRQLGPLGGAMQKARLAADARHDDRFAGLDDFAGNALPEPIAHLTARRDRAGRRLELHVAGLVVQQHDRAAHGAVMPAENFEHALQRGAQIERRGRA